MVLYNTEFEVENNSRPTAKIELENVFLDLPCQTYGQPAMYQCGPRPCHRKKIPVFQSFQTSFDSSTEVVRGVIQQVVEKKFGI